MSYKKNSKLIFSALALCFFICLRGTAYSQDTHLNLLSNGDFEEGFDINSSVALSWQNYSSGGSLTVDYGNDPIPFEGSNAQNITYTYDPTNSGYCLFRQGPIKVINGHSYEISLMMKSDRTANVQVYLRQSQSPFIRYVTQSFTIDQQWQEQTFTAINSYDDAGAFFYIYIKPVTGSTEVTVSIDDVKLFDLTKPVINGVVYLDSASGNDGNDGLTEPTAWRTLDKLNQHDILPGSQVLFKRGGEWQGTFNIFSGTVQAPVLYGAYGVGNNPVIDRSELITEWVQDPTNNIIYKAEVNSKVVQVFADDKRLTVAHYPNDRYLYTPEDSTGNYIVSDPTEQIDDVVGSEMHIRSTHYSLEDRIINSYDTNNNHMVWDQEALKHTGVKGYGYYLANRSWMIDQAGEWAFDANGDLYIHKDDLYDENHASREIKVSRPYHGIQAIGKEYFTIQGLTVKNAGDNGIYIEGSNHFTISDVDIINAGKHGIYIYNNNGPGSEITNCSINNSGKAGIGIYLADGITISGNHISNTRDYLFAQRAGEQDSSWWDGAGIYLNSSINVNVSGNIISDSGYSGIIAGSSSNIYDNVIDRSCLVFDDGAGIYLTGSYSTVAGNFISNSIGSNEGTPEHGTCNFTAAHGIYLDSGANNMDISNNTIDHSGFRGLFLHNAYENTLSGNVTFANGVELGMHENNPPGEHNSMYDNTIEDNLFFHLDPTEAVKLQSDNNNDADFADFYNNEFVNMCYSVLVVETYNNNSTANRYNLSEWEQYHDPNNNPAPGYTVTGSIQFNPFTILPYKILNVDPVNLITNGSFDQTGVCTPWSSWSNDPTRTDSLDWIEDAGDGGFLEYNSSDQCAEGSSQFCTYAISNSFHLDRNQHYLLDLDYAALQDNTDVPLIVRRAGPTYESLSCPLQLEAISATTSWQYYSRLFKAGDTLDNARLDFPMIPGLTLYLDNISIKQVTTEDNDPEDNAVILINKTSGSQTLSCLDVLGINKSDRCDEFIDLDSSPVVWPVTLAPYSSKIIVWENNPFMNCTDSDNDGYAIEGRVCGPADCDDSDAAIYPGGPTVRLAGGINYYSTIQTAYDAASDGSTIEVNSATAVEDLNFNLNKTLTLTGGYDCGYSTVTGRTVVNGDVTISSGQVTIENLEIQ